MAAVDDHCELDGARPAELGERVERRPHRATGEQHVVDEDDDATADVDRHLGRTERLHRPQADVVAVEGDVERAHGHRDALEALDRGGESPRDRQPPRVEADEHDTVGAVVALHDLVGDAGVRAAQVVGVEDGGTEDKRTAVSGGRVQSRLSGAGGGVHRICLRRSLTGLP